MNKSPLNPSNEPRELLCQICDREYPVWFAPNKLWNAVMRNSDGTDKFQFVCPLCFALEAERAGIKGTAWKLTLENKKAPTTPSNLEDTSSLKDILDKLTSRFSRIYYGAVRGDTNTYQAAKYTVEEIDKAIGQIQSQYISREEVLKALEDESILFGSGGNLVKKHIRNKLRQEIKTKLNLE